MEDRSTDPPPWLSHKEDTKTQDRTAHQQLWRLQPSCTDLQCLMQVRGGN